MLKKTVLFCFFMLPLLLWGKVWVYPDSGREASPHYKLKVIQKDAEFTSFVHYSQADFGDTGRSSSWSAFSFSDSISIEVELVQGTVETCVIRPILKNVPYEIEGNRIRIDLAKPQMLAIEINGNKAQSLFIFADPPEEFAPQGDEKGLWTFGPGMHNIGVVEVPDTVSHIYIAGGAWVQGILLNKHKASSFKITGRGILSAQGLETQKPRIIDLQGNGLNVLIEGITVLNGASGGISLKQRYATVRNCKIMGWQANTEGLQCGDNAVVENCFFRCNGDALKVYGNHFRAQNCVFWQNESGAPFQFSWNQNNDGHNFRIANCQVIHCEHAEEADNTAIFSAVHGGNGKLSNYLFENISIEGDIYRLLKLTIRTSKYDDMPGYGTLGNIRFKNVEVEGNSRMANEIWGYNEEHKISAVSFENLVINGSKITDLKSGNFKVNLNTVSGVVFE